MPCAPDRAPNRNLATDACPAGGSADVILVPAGTYTLTRGSGDDTAVNGDLDITSTVTLQGAGADVTIIAGGGGWTDRIFEVLTTTVTLRNGNQNSDGGGLKNTAGAVTLVNSSVVSNTVSGANQRGGGLYSKGAGNALTLVNTTVMSNSATGDDAGGIYVNGGALVLTNSAILSNTTASSGGGAYVTGSGATLIATGSTLWANTATGNGGGLRLAGGAATLTNVTLSGNSSDEGGGLYVSSSTLMLVSSAVLSNTTGNDGGGVSWKPWPRSRSSPAVLAGHRLVRLGVSVGSRTARSDHRARADQGHSRRARYYRPRFPPGRQPGPRGRGLRARSGAGGEMGEQEFRAIFPQM